MTHALDFLGRRQIYNMQKVNVVNLSQLIFIVRVIDLFETQKQIRHLCQVLFE